MKKLIVTLIAFCISVSLIAIKTCSKNYNGKYNYHTRIINEVLPYFGFDNPKKYRKEHLKKFRGVNFNRKRGFQKETFNMNIAYDIFGPKTADYHIVVVHGLNETFIKYAELMYDLEALTGNNIRFYVMDQRGYGFSDRFKIRHPEAAYVDEFDKSAKDIKIFMDRIVIPDVFKTTGDKKSIYLFAHSMGGGISVRFLEKYHEYFQKVILDSPMLSIKAYGITDNIVLEAIASEAIAFGYGESYIDIPGIKKQESYKKYKKFEDNRRACTNSPERYYYGYKTIYGSCKKHGLYFKNAVGGLTWNWIYRACLLSGKILYHLDEIDPAVSVQIFQAENDMLVKTWVQDLFAEAVNKCDVIRFRNIVKGVKSRHEIYMEIDEIRGNGEDVPNLNKPVTVIDRIMKFFELKYVTGNPKYI